MHSPITYVAIPTASTFQPGKRMELQLETVRLSPSNWPRDESQELERFRVLPGTKEFAWRSSIERTLIDGLLRPDRCAGFETVVLAWARALRDPAVSWDAVAEIGKRLGKATARRTAFMLRLFNLQETADRHFAALEVRDGQTPLDRGNGFGLPRSGTERDPKTGVLVNVPWHHLRGWASGESV
jgi:hypothetical protein